MKVVGLMEHGGPEVLKVYETDDVHAGPGQIRIANKAAAVSPTDVVGRDGMRAEQQKAFPPPWVPGMDAAGVIDEIGPNVNTDLKVGDNVMAMVVPEGQHGGYASSIVLNQSAVVPTPTSLSHAEASSLPMNTLTARLSLDLLDLKEGQTIAVTGGPGAYGGYVIELAKLEGLTVIADSKPDDEDLLRSLGVDIIIPRGEGFADRVREHFPEGVDGIADGALLNELAIPAVKNGGSFTSIRGFKGEPQRDISFTATWVTKYNEDFNKLDQIRQQVNAGKITPRVAGTVRPEEAHLAHERLEAGGSRGRWVIEF